MIAVLFFTVFVAADVDCDGEVTLCNDCVTSSEKFAQCQWCSTTGHCHGKFDLTATCPNNGVWQSTCAADATTTQQTSLSVTLAPIMLRTFEELYQDTSDTMCDRNQVISMRVCISRECGPINSLCAEIHCTIYCVRDLFLPWTCANYYNYKCKNTLDSLKKIGESCNADCLEGGKNLPTQTPAPATQKNVACLKKIDFMILGTAALIYEIY